jgi:RNA polymerase sigma-70 factor (ECF subfamily)
MSAATAAADSLMRSGAVSAAGGPAVSSGTEDSLRTREEDQLLVEKAQNGDTSAFDALVIKHSPRLYGLIYHMTANREDTSDLLQDVFAKAYRALKRFRGQSSFYTWIYSIATNLTLNFLKKRSRRQTCSLDDLDSGIERDKEFIDATAGSDPVREAGLRELQRKLNEAMQQLSESHRAVVTMFDIQGMPHAEIARIMGTSEGTIRSRLYYAHQQLQSLLADFLK